MSFDLLSWLSALGWGVVGYILPFVAVLTIVVFFHELGHFLIARRCGVKILTFSIGFGPELFGFNDRHGTRWKISAIPLGGYVKFFGDDNVASAPDQDALTRMSEAERADSFVFQSGGPARGHCRGRAAREFRSGGRDLRRRVQLVRQASRPRRASIPSFPIAPRKPRESRRAT